MSRPKSFDELVRAIARFPSIGPKTASRIALWLLNQPMALSEEIATALVAARKTIRLCNECFGYSETAKCGICEDAGRNRALLCVVEEPEDAWRIEATGKFHGLYHVLGGVLSPLDGVTPEKLRIEQLLARLRVSSEISEVILATDFDTEGNATSGYIAELIAGIRRTDGAPPPSASRLAFGLPVGGELAYSDDATIAHAMANRRKV